MPSQAKHFYDFGPFRLDSAERVLLRNGEMVSLSPKLLEILWVLVRNGGHIVEKEQLLNEVWPDAFVEEANINVGISALRKALGDTPERNAYIETIPRRGYRFVAPVEVVSGEPAELVVQRRTITRIVQEEEEISAEGELAAQPPLLPATETAIEARAEQSAPRKLSPDIAGVFGLALLIALGGGALYLKTHARERLDRVSFSGDKLLVWNEAGKLAWEYRFTQPLYQTMTLESSRLLRFVDINGDSEQELFAAVPFAQPHNPEARHVVYCFSHTGQLLWRYEPQFKLQFPGQAFEGPWRVTDTVVSPGRGPKTIWVAFAHLTWWPSFVVKLDAKGGAALQFVNAGHLTGLEYVENRTGHYLLAAGINNEFKSAMLAVIREDQVSAVSPQTAGSMYQSSLTTTQTPTGSGEWPHRYFVFAPSELFRLRGATFHQPKGLNVRNSTIEIATFEGDDPFLTGAYLAGIYELTPEFELKSASFSDDYWNLHRRMEKEGKINHPAAQCPDRNPLNGVRVWSPEKGWERAPVLSAKTSN